MSHILDLYAALATKVVTIEVDGQPITPTVYGLDKLPTNAEHAMLPCRLLLPMQPRGEGRDYRFNAMGPTAELTWRISDLMLWSVEGQGIGLEDIAPVLVGYAGEYAEMLRTNRSMDQAQCHLIGARFVYGTFEYPEQSGTTFLGCACELDFEEVLSGC